MFASALASAVRVVLNPYPECIVALLKIVCHIKREGKISVFMLSEKVTVPPDTAVLINRPKMQQEPLAILGAVGNHFRRVSAARTLLDNGKNASDLQRLCGIPDYPARKTMEAARRFTPEFCRRAAELVLETDYKIKTSYDDPERLLELLLLQLAQEGRNG